MGEEKTDNRKISQRWKKGRNMERDVGKGRSGDGQRAGFGRCSAQDSLGIVYFTLI